MREYEGFHGRWNISEISQSLSAVLTGRPFHFKLNVLSELLLLLLVPAITQRAVSQRRWLRHSSVCFPSASIDISRDSPSTIREVCARKDSGCARGD